jgi:hypothetical protein
VKFQRRKSVPDQGTDQGDGTPGAVDATRERPDGRRSDGPWDLTEASVAEDDPTQVDLGGLLVRGREGLELRLQVDEASQEVSAVLLVTAQGALELRPFAAPRNGDIWDDIRREIGAETTRRGGTATEEEGEYGPELRVMMPVTTPEGKAATQPSRVLGVRGPRWLLRATFLGRPAMDPQPDGDLETALKEVVVVRGEAPMAPGDPLPLKVPANAQPVQQRQG